MTKMKAMMLAAVAGCALMFSAGNAQAQYGGRVAIGGGGIYINNGRGFQLQLGGPQFGYGYGYGYGRPYVQPYGYRPPYVNPYQYRYHPPVPHYDYHRGHYHYHNPSPWRRW